MKKLLFLISLSLLSQNISIAADSLGGSFYSMPPVPVSHNEEISDLVKDATQNKTNEKEFALENFSSKINNNPDTSKISNFSCVNGNENFSSLIDSSKPPVPVFSANEGLYERLNESDSSATLTSTTNNDVKNSSHKTFSPLKKQEEKIEQKNVVEENNQRKFDLRADVKTELKKNSKPPVIVEKLPVPTDPTVTRITIKRIEFSPASRVFSEAELQQLVTPLLENPVSLDDIKMVVNGITRCYILGDYPTSKAYLPPQTVTKDGVLKIGLLEGTVGNISVEGNRWTKTPYIEKKITVKEGDLFRLGDIEQDVIKFNNNNAVKLRVGLNAGDEPGETNIVLNTEEQFPFHFAFMTDNQGRQTIGRVRWGGMLAADSLFGYRDRLSLGGYLGTGNRVGFADYNVPVGKYGTRIGASISAGNIDVVRGPMKPFGIGGTSQVYSLYATHPWFDRQGVNISSYSAANLKHSATDIRGFEVNDISTFSLTQGFTARKDTDKGIWYTGHYGSFGMKALGGDEYFIKYDGNITRLHDFGKGIVGQFRVSGQYSPNNRLPWMEQFQIGGLSTVRGYSEALLIGKSGYFASAEILTPIPILPKRVGSDKLGYIYPREMVKAAIFMDNGMIFPYKGGEAVDSGEFLMSWGWGLRFNIKKDLAARLYWGYGLQNRYDVDQKMGRLHFDITCAPDIGRIVAGRQPAAKKHNKKNNAL